MSVDFGLFARMIVNNVFPTEKFISSAPVVSQEEIKEWKFRVNIAAFASIVISLILGVIAFILSWSCNTAMGYNTIVKSVFGAVAFVFGLTYIIVYLVMRWDVCMKIIK